jgi:SUKH-4 immunity protein
MPASEDITEWAGRDGIITAKPELVGNWSITDAEKEILLRVGLPKRVEPFFEASIQEQEQPVVSSRSHGALYKIGWDLGNDIAVGGESAGVFAVDPAGNEPDIFVNSTLVGLVSFLHETGKVRRDFSSMSKEAIDAAIADLRAKLQGIDPPALPDFGSWWSLVFEQMEAGLF